ncbi:MAG: prepilin-type N-terminal cleavage/methylation domain-containing protein [Gemmatimonadota bacterium]
MSLNRRGVTLVEMLVSITLLALVGGLALQLLLRQHWTGEAQSQRAALQATMRAAITYLESELRELGGSPGDPDIVTFAAESLTYRAMRSAGIGCRLSPTALTVRSSDLYGYRAPQPGRDSLLLFRDGSPATSSDDQWLHLPLFTVSAGSCGSQAALILGTAIDTSVTPLSGFPPLAPFRTFEIMQARLYASGGDYWLGARSVSAAEIIQPLAGPFLAHGLAMRFLDSLAVPATGAERIRSVDVALLGVSASPIRSGAGMGLPQRRTDSLGTRIMLRNW